MFTNTSLTNPFAFGQLMPASALPAALYVRGDAVGDVTLELIGQPGAYQRVDEVRATIRPEFSDVAFPAMQFTASNYATVLIDLPSPREIENPSYAGFGLYLPGIPAIQWHPSVDVQTVGPHLSCDQFVVGIVQTIRYYQGTHHYVNGLKMRSEWQQSPCCDKVPNIPGPYAFYAAPTTKDMASCGSTGPLPYEDAPIIQHPWFNPCSQNGSDLSQIVFNDTFGTWLAAYHKTSGCYTVAKHFEWQQSATTTSVSIPSKQINSIRQTTHGNVDSIVGAAPELSSVCVPNAHCEP